jgi:hypothetical protein
VSGTTVDIAALDRRYMHNSSVNKRTLCFVDRNHKLLLIGFLGDKPDRHERLEQLGLGAALEAHTEEPHKR